MNMNVEQNRRQQVNIKTLLKFTFIFHICSVSNSKQIQKKKLLEKKRRKNLNKPFIRFTMNVEKKTKIPPASHLLHGKTLEKDEA